MHGEQNLSTLYVSGADSAFAPLANHFAVTRQNLYQERAHLALVGTAIFGHQLASRDELIGTPFFEEFLRPAGAVHMLGLSLVREPDRFAELSLFREERLEPHGDEELRIGNVLAGHLRRALLFGLSFRAADARAENLGAVLESFCVGTVLIDIDGKLVFANAEAIALLTGRAPLQVMRGVIRPAYQADRDRWHDLLARLAGNGGMPSGATGMFGAGTEQPLLVQAIPFAPRAAEVWGIATGPSRLGLLLLSAPDRKPGSVAEAARMAFGLTGAEAELAAALVAGESLNEFAERRKRSLTTVKTHLRAIFDKTGVHRQSDLVRQLAALAILRRAD